MAHVPPVRIADIVIIRHNHTRSAGGAQGQFLDLVEQCLGVWRAVRVHQVLKGIIIIDVGRLEGRPGGYQGQETEKGQDRHAYIITNTPGCQPAPRHGFDHPAEAPGRRQDHRHGNMDGQPGHLLAGIREQGQAADRPEDQQGRHRDRLLGFISIREPIGHLQGCPFGYRSSERLAGLRAPQFFGGSDHRSRHRPQGWQELVNRDQEEGIVIERLAAACNILLGRPVSKQSHQAAHNAGRGGEKRAIQYNKGNKENVRHAAAICGQTTTDQWQRQWRPGPPPRQ